MAKNVCVNKELISSEVNYLLSNLRNSIAFGGRLPYCVVYLANVRQASLDAIKEMGIKYEAAGRWGHRLYAPKKGTKLWEALFKGSKVLVGGKPGANAYKNKLEEIVVSMNVAAHSIEFLSSKQDGTEHAETAEPQPVPVETAELPF